MRWRRRKSTEFHFDDVRLRLPFPPTVGYMTDHAHHIAGVALEIDGEHVDFSVASLEAVDRLLGLFHAAHADAGSIGGTLFQFGAYVGEVCVRHAGGEWVELPADHPLGGGWPMISLPDDAIVNPIGKAFKRAANGSEDSVVHFYTVLVEG